MQEETIRASEIGEYVHCHRAWWLGHVEGIENANRSQLESGTAAHQAHGARVREAQGLQRAALALLVVALVCAVLLAARVAGWL